MKTLLKVIVLLLITQVVYGQKKSVNAEQLFITNRITGKSVKLFTSEATLKNFDELIKIDTMYIGVETDGRIHKRELLDPDQFLRYTFKNIEFYINTQHKLSTFYTRSGNIILEKKGMFAISPGDKLSDISDIFPDEIKSARIINRGKDVHSLLAVMIQLQYLHPKIKDYVDIDENIGLLYNPESKILEEIFLWVAP